MKRIILLLILISLSQTQICIADDLDIWFEYDENAPIKLNQSIHYWILDNKLKVGISVPLDEYSSCIYNFRFVKIGSDRLVVYEENMTYNEIPVHIRYTSTKKIWQVTLPENLDGVYRIGYIQRDANQTIISNHIETFEIPAQIQNIVYNVEKKIYRLYENPSVIIQNNGAQNILHDNYAFWFDHEISNNYVEVKPTLQNLLMREGWFDITYISGKAYTRHYVIPLMALFPGVYRINQYVRVEDRYVILSSEFYYPGSIFYILTAIALIYVLYLRKSPILNRYVALISFTLTSIQGWNTAFQLIDYPDMIVVYFIIGFTGVYLVFISLALLAVIFGKISRMHDG